MPWTITLSPDKHYVTVAFSGKPTARELRDAFDNAIGIEREAKVSLALVDCTEADPSGVSFDDIYHEVSRREKAGMRVATRQAILIPPSSPLADKATFYETVLLNRGYYARTFEDRQAAIEWLLLPAKPPTTRA